MSDDLPSLILRGRELNTQIAAASEELKKIKVRLIEGGPGEYQGAEGARALVIFPAASIKPDEAGIAVCRRLLTPIRFAKLFVESIVVTPVKSFREVAAAVLDPQVAAECIAACEKDSFPSVRFS